MTNDGNIRCDVVVVGAGLAGLSAAATAARAGASVTVLDARVAGGRARSAVKHGYVLNEGGHALCRAAGGRAVLAGLGVRVSGNGPALSEYRAVWDGQIVKLPVSAGAILTTRLLGARSKRQVATWFANLRGTVRAAGDLSLGEWLDHHTVRSDLRKYVTAMARLTTYNPAPEAMPARSVLGQLAGGVDYLDGGWQSVVDELLGVCGRAGVRVLTGEAAVGAARRAGGWTVATARRELSAITVIAAAGGPAAAVGLLGGDPAGWGDRAGPVARAACLDVGGRRGDVSFLLSADEPLYLSLHSDAARLAPPGRALYSLMQYLVPDDTASASERRAALEAHAARGGLPIGEDREIDRFLAAPVVAWGTPQAGVARPTGTELADRGFLVAGDWVGRRLLADASLTSGAAAGTWAAARARVAA